jgi:hypothetical protein
MQLLTGLLYTQKYGSHRQVKAAVIDFFTAENQSILMWLPDHVQTANVKSALKHFDDKSELAERAIL